MVNNKSIKPIASELPSHFADRLGIYYASLVNQEHKKGKRAVFYAERDCFTNGVFCKIFRHFFAYP